MFARDLPSQGMVRGRNWEEVSGDDQDRSDDHFMGRLGLMKIASLFLRGVCDLCNLDISTC